MKKLLTIFSIILISLAVSAYSTGNSNAALYDTYTNKFNTIFNYYTLMTGQADTDYYYLNIFDTRSYLDKNGNNLFNKENLKYYMGFRINNVDSASIIIKYSYRIKLTDSIYAWSTATVVLDSLKIEDSLYSDTVSTAVKNLLQFADSIKYQFIFRGTVVVMDTFADTLELDEAADLDSLMALYTFVYDTTRDTSAAAGIDTFIIASDTTTEFADSSYVFFKLSYGE